MHNRVNCMNLMHNHAIEFSKTNMFLNIIFQSNTCLLYFHHFKFLDTRMSFQFTKISVQFINTKVLITISYTQTCRLTNNYFNN